MMHLKDNAIIFTHAIKVFTAISKCKLHIVSKWPLNLLQNIVSFQLYSLKYYFMDYNDHKIYTTWYKHTFMKCNYHRLDPWVVW